MTDSRQFSNEQLHKMSEQMANEIRALQDALKTEQENKQKLEAAQRERDEAMKVMQANLNKVKDEKKMQYGEVLNKEVLPYLHQLRDSAKDPKLVPSIATVESSLMTGLENAFMDDSQMSNFNVISAIASANAVTSSRLEGLIKTEQEWGQKYEQLLKQKEELEKASADRFGEVEKTVSSKDQMISSLKQELEELRSNLNKSRDSITNTEAHFSAVPTQAPEVVQATASAKKSGFDSLFDFTPSVDWRSSFDLPGSSAHATR